MYEVDFPWLMEKKKQFLQENNRDNDHVTLIGFDLECNADQLISLLVDRGMNFNGSVCPTLILTECLLVFMAPEKGNKLISTLARTFQNTKVSSTTTAAATTDSTACIVNWGNYDMMCKDDPFGKVSKAFV